MSAGDDYSCAVRESGERVCWGWNSATSSMDAPAESYPPVSLNDGAWHDCEVLDSAELACSGNNDYGQLDAPPGRYQAVSAGTWHMCGLRESGEVACWGAGVASGPAAVPAELAAAELMFEPESSGEPAVAPSRGVLSVHAGTEHTCALLPSGDVTCWGEAGQRVPLPAGPYRSLSVGGHRYTCGVQASGAVVCAGIRDALFNQAPGAQDRYRSVSAGGRHACAFRESGELDCWGWNGYGQAVAVPGPYESVSAGDFHTCAVLDSGQVVCWGRNNHGQALGMPGRYTAVSAGAAHNCALGESGEVVCWGNNESGQTDAPSGRYQAVTVGEAHSCALAESGEVVCWGSNESGQTDAPAGRYRAISAGGLHTCAVTDSDEVVCWGDNESGQTDVPRLLAASGAE